METFEATVAAFYHMIGQGKFVEAIDRYYDENISSSDNEDPAIDGLEAMRKAVIGFMNNTSDMKLELENSIIINGYSVAKWHYRFTNTKIGAMDYQQISIAHWKNGKIIKEQHLYNLQP